MNVKTAISTVAALAMATAILPSATLAAPLDPITCHAFTLETGYNVNDYSSNPMGTAVVQIVGGWCTNGSEAWPNGTQPNASVVSHSGLLGAPTVSSKGYTTSGELDFYVHWVRPITCPVWPYNDATVGVDQLIRVSSGGSVIGYSGSGWANNPTCMRIQTWQEYP